MKNLKASDVSAKLALTEQGQQWLAQFEEADRRIARDFLSLLTLVSHSEFESSIQGQVFEKSKTIEGPIALFAVREVVGYPDVDYFIANHNENNPETLNALAHGSDIGSEGRIVSTIRNISKSEPGKFLNHPSIIAMRSNKCRNVFLVDDLIGSGNQSLQFLDWICRNATIRSWVSLRYIKFWFVTYAASELGLHRISKHRFSPVVIHKIFCPTIKNVQPKKIQKNLTELIKKYSRRTSKAYMAYGYRSSMAILVFEHGCPNNTPPILWAPRTKKFSEWFPLFPNRTVIGGVHSAFPPEMRSKDAVSLLIELGYRKLAAAPAHLFRHPLPHKVLTMLALLSKGANSPSSLCYSLSMTIAECNTLLEACINAGYVTPGYRLTTSGLRELKGAVKSRQYFRDALPSRGSDMYYPKSLRGHI